MTTNLPLNQIYRVLDEANTKDPNIRITSSIGLTVEFLDVCVNNNQGQLKTTVFHKPAAEPYILPFLSDHPRRVHRNVIRGPLFRAVRVCSDVQDFDKERLNTELMLLLNGYPPRFVSYHFKRFFEQNNAISLMEQLDNGMFSHELYHLWNKYYIYEGSSLNNIKLKIVTQRNKSLSQLLIRKKPPKSMLINVDTTKFSMN